VSVAIQFTFQVLPLSVENDCSNLQDSGLMFNLTKRGPGDRMWFIDFLIR
jgi:hypothetical protein